MEAPKFSMYDNQMYEEPTVEAPIEKYNTEQESF